MAGPWVREFIMREDHKAIRKRYARKPAAVTPQVWTLNKASSGTYVTEAKAQYAYVGPADNFLTKLAAAEAKDSVSAEDAKAAPNRVRMDLIPKVAKSPPKKPRGR
jgi:hypothetical protein